MGCAVGRIASVYLTVQHIAHDLMEKRGKSESNAIQMAVGIVKRWCRGGGNVDAGTKAAACKATSEWEAKKASAHAKGAVQHSELDKWRMPSIADELAVRTAALSRVVVFEQELGQEGMVALLAEGLLAEADPGDDGKLALLAEGLRFDLMTVSGVDIPPLRRVQEARRRDPFDLLALAEDFVAGELRDFHGRWRSSGGSVRRLGRDLTPSSVAGMNTRMGRPKSDAQRRYEGGVVRASAQARAAHAAKPQISLEQLPQSIGRGAWTQGAISAASRLKAQRERPGEDLVKDVASGKALDTEAIHSKSAGGERVYSSERQALHEAIVAKLLQGKAEHPGRARAIFTAGGPASGKSGLEKFGMLTMPKDVVHANPDVVREMLPEYKALVKAGRKDASNLTHEEASHVAKLVTKIALGRQHHVLVDTTGDSGPGKFAGKIRQAQRAGHQTEVHYATTDVGTAIARAEARGKRGGRFVPEKYLRDTHRDVSLRFDEVAKIRGLHRLQVVDTTERPNRVIASMARGAKLRVHDEGAFGRFKAKARA